MEKKSLEDRIQRLEDIYEIQNLMSRHVHRGAGGADFMDLYAQKTPGVTAEVGNSGVIVGMESLKSKRKHVKEGEHEHPPGFMAMQTLTTPVI